MSIDSHNLTIIEADGKLTEPLTVQKFDMLTGQCYSVVLNANQTVDNYWFNAPFRMPPSHTPLSVILVLPLPTLLL
ncbi:Cu-oxidase-domain-containing protein [Macrolepiota fuliginosa MF-IS2]|uniref:Cu-oxidase-domain-containing protein n=1 Tax=Macrolepiota fuliginosa MF-IS2 TaxID=1400762 RepID=A0A9P5WYK1_9AGAR|nr:Cu-oxidase-domain-containing protein [Macrolepiota fuliginosa MF-IS2]